MNDRLTSCKAFSRMGFRVKIEYNDEFTYGRVYEFKADFSIGLCVT